MRLPSNLINAMPRPRKRPRASSYGSSDASDRIFATRREGIFKKASVLAQMVPGTRVAIFVERNQEIFTFRSDENLTSWPPSMEEIVSTILIYRLHTLMQNSKGQATQSTNFPAIIKVPPKHACRGIKLPHPAEAPQKFFHFRARSTTI